MVENYPGFPDGILGPDLIEICASRPALRRGIQVRRDYGRRLEQEAVQNYGRERHV